MKYSILSFFMAASAVNIYAQKSNLALSINGGTNVSLTQSKAYKPGIFLSTIVAYGVSKTKNDAITFGVAHQTIKFNYAPTGGLNMTDIKIGYRFFPSAKAAFYLHPTVGIGFFSGAYGGKKIQVNTGAAVGYLIKIGNGGINIFAAFNQFRFSPSLSLVNSGIGYQFNIKSDKQ